MCGGRNRDADVENGGKRGWDKMRESSTDIYTLPSVNRQRVGSCCITRALSLVLCDEPEEWDGDGVEGRLEREGAFLLLFSRSIVSSFL